PPSMDRYVDDVAALLDATGTERATVLGTSHGGTVATSFALRHPERTENLVLLNALCCDRRNAIDESDTESYVRNTFLPRLDADYNEFVDWLARCCIAGDAPGRVAEAATFIQATSSPHTWRMTMRGLVDIDLRPRLAEISVPTLVIQAVGDDSIPVSHGRAYAQGIHQANYLELDSDAHVTQLDGRAVPLILTAIEEQVTGRVQHTAERIVTTVLFTDIVSSTAQQRDAGDAEWRNLHAQFETGTQRRVEQFDGRVIQFTGDGVMAAFPSPTQALRAARALVDDAKALGLEIRAGVHSGEAYEVEKQLFGTCVNVAARVAAEAAAGEILTTQVVSGLVEGSAFSFEDAGSADLTGVGVRQLIRLKRG
ncbi:MAG: adenylate/guanylate cyclase domain-containing protein, partial [Candidatus Binatia bacterium]